MRTLSPTQSDGHVNTCPKILKRWYAGCNIDIDSKTLVFLPPQMFSKNDVDSAKKRLRKSDNFFKSIGFKKQGGLITFKVSKQ